MPARVIAGSFALVSFSFALLLGLYVGNDAFTILGRALVCSGFCYLIGLIVGHVGRSAVLDHIEQYASANPIPKYNQDGEPEVSENSMASEHAVMETQDASGEGPADRSIDTATPQAA